LEKVGMSTNQQKNIELLKKLNTHKRNLKPHFEKASKFLVKCQIVEPYVKTGTLHGSVCPWEIDSKEYSFSILEDFHDTLEAIWVWSCYAQFSGKRDFKPNIDWAWEYVTKNWNRFIKERENSGLYDCSHLLLTGAAYGEIFNDKQYEKLVFKAGNRIENYIANLKSTAGREYSDPFWMTYCLSLAAKSLKKDSWLRASKNFVRKSIVETKNPLEKEPHHKGPGGHDFFSKNANQMLALMSCFEQEKEVILKKFLPSLPKGFVSRCVDENAWNAHLALALGKAYTFTGNEEFLHRYFAIMDELKKRASHAALPRDSTFPVRESWVTFFYAYACSAFYGIFERI
jgi:hypothetical protein